MKLSFVVDKFLGRSVGSIFATPIGRYKDGLMPVPEQCYFDLRLEVMDIASKNRLMTEYYPVLQGNVSFGALGADVTTTALITPEIPGHEQQSRLTRVHLRGQELAPLQVYRGGDIDVALGLYATPGDDWAKQFLGFAKAVSEVAGSASLSAAVAVAQPLKVAFDALLSRGKVTLELGLKVELIRAGLGNHTYFLLAGTEQAVEIEDLSFNGTEVLYRGSPLLGADIILISLNFSKERSDLYTMPVALSAQKTLKGIAEILVGGGAEVEAGIADLYRRFAAEVMLHDQLTMGDKARLIQDIRSNINELRTAIAVPESRSGNVAGRLKVLSDSSPAIFELKPTETPFAERISMDEAMQF